MSDTFTPTERWRLFYALSPLAFVVAIWIMGDQFWHCCLEPQRNDDSGRHLQWPVRLVQGLFIGQLVWSLIVVSLTRGIGWKIAVLFLSIVYLMIGFYLFMIAVMGMTDVWL